MAKCWQGRWWWWRWWWRRWWRWRRQRWWAVWNVSTRGKLGWIIWLQWWGTAILQCNTFQHFTTLLNRGWNTLQKNATHCISGCENIMGALNCASWCGPRMVPSWYSCLSLPRQQGLCFEICMDGCFGLCDACLTHVYISLSTSLWPVFLCPLQSRHS